jgi:hypothetical protein
MKRILVCTVFALAVNMQAQQAPPAGSTPSPSMSTSLGLHAFPSKNQPPEVQSKDEYACYGWSKQNTGFDPVAAETANSQAQANKSSAPAAPGAKGAAGGAAMGATAGAIGGDAGKGAAVGATAGGLRGRRAKKEAEKQAQKQQQGQAQKQQASLDGFKKAFGACMEGKGYTVK